MHTKPLRDSYATYRNTVAGYEQAQKTYAESERNIAEQAALDETNAALETAEETRQRKNALKRATASRQAAFGGQGIDTTDGSGEAVILGLFQESDEDKKYRDRLDTIKRQSREQNNAAKRRRNLLNLQQNYTSAQDGLIRNLDQIF